MKYFAFRLNIQPQVRVGNKCLFFYCFFIFATGKNVGIARPSHLNGAL